MSSTVGDQAPVHIPPVEPSPATGLTSDGQSNELLVIASTAAENAQSASVSGNNTLPQLEFADYEAQAKHEALEDQRTNRLERVKYANRIFKLMEGWLCSVFFLLILVGMGTQAGWFKLSDSVLIALVSGTSVNVIGIFAIVVNYLFNKGAGNGNSTPSKPKGTPNPPSAKAPRRVVKGPSSKSAEESASEAGA